ncbi:MAG TPA: hypothetical protein VMD51_14660, partial [Mycobacterium sp.]|nr:hypothetical protein [Mycobacterium sp.]
MTSTTVLCVLDDGELRDIVDRVSAAVGLRAMTASAALTRKSWSTAAAVVLDESGARRCAGMPRRAGLILVCPGEPHESSWRTAIAVGAQHVCALPGHEDGLTRHLADAAEEASGVVGDGRVVAVVGGRG